MRTVDVFTLDEVNEKLEWHARKLCLHWGKDPDVLIDGYHLTPAEKRPQWTAFLEEAKRFMIGVEAWFGEHGHVLQPHSNGKVIEDAVLMEVPEQSGCNPAF